MVGFGNGGTGDWELGTRKDDAGTRGRGDAEKIFYPPVTERSRSASPLVSFQGMGIRYWGDRFLGNFRRYLLQKFRFMVDFLEKVIWVSNTHPLLGKLSNFGNANNFPTGAIDPLNLRGHLARRDNILTGADAAGTVKFGASDNNLKPLFST